ncbi:hypothetical protein GBAR_LOCUS20698 [Geodia barretti]|uniref:Uncharacterized protein n=1 Tax=Geodia barretti TaxID=519541 RepID=A0AA35SWP5_GEOBA|nr:hypothetical protein GBAR_LOCUS20698 [Geodia barretti]
MVRSRKQSKRMPARKKFKIAKKARFTVHELCSPLPVY